MWVFLKRGTSMSTSKVTVALVVVLTAVSGALVALKAQQAEVKRTVLQRGDVSGVTGREAVMAQADIPPGGTVGKHNHPGEEVSYVLEGTLTLEVDGQAAKTLKAGEVYFIEAGKAHNAWNKGTGTTKVLGIYVIEKGKPVTSPVK